jgi:large subunit ribosomal protein L21
MFAVIQTGGKQYKVSPGQLIVVEKLPGESGQTLQFDQVLMVSIEGSLTIGQPTVSGASVSALLVEQSRTDKVIVFKKRRRQGYRRKKGHRQDITVLRISDISLGGVSKKTSPSTASKKEKEASSPAEGEKKASPRKTKKTEES